MIVQRLLSEAIQTLGKKCTLDAEILLSHAINKDRGWMLAHTDLEIDETQAAVFRAMVVRRTAGESVAYILGSKEFFGLDFKVDARVLVPRPETEMLVEMGLEALDATPEATVIDIGTGSGAVAVSIAKHAPHARIIAIDISRDALDVAKENARHHNVLHHIAFECGNLLEPADLKPGDYIIVANLPYLSYGEYMNEPSIHAEPKGALVAEEDGNALYRALFKQLQTLPVDIHWLAFCEFDPRHLDWILDTARVYFPNKKIEIQKDLAGLARVLSIRPV